MLPPGDSGGVETLARVGVARKAALFDVMALNAGLDAAWIAEAAREAVAGLNIAHAASATADHVSTCRGVAALPRADLAARRLIEAADENLFVAKDSGRNRVVSS